MKKTVFITGASSGFGKACAELFAKGDYRLILNARRIDRLQNLKADLEKEYNAEVYLLDFDVRNNDAVVKSIQSLPANWRSVNILINNAGLAVGRDLFQDAELDDWERMIDTNIKGLLYVSKAIIPWMIEQGGGHILNVDSLAGHEVYPMGNVYCATKYAVKALSKGMRIDLLPHKIKVSNISPGLAETEFSVVRFKGDTTKADDVYSGFTPLSAMDVAEIIYFTATRPAHVNIEEVTILPTAQSDSRTVLKETNSN
ncbi:MAG: SDR family NAD(P)-dependent oxidoreductase [Chitinophagales bacterium]|nr:SDR family NAD(P)-dependent oxidoreductase [Bacteroidota bacterium]MBK8488178.1 SDR family NAD(P)-dependent oxidoreductase [Bacteroidota bacterium]